MWFRSTLRFLVPVLLVLFTVSAPAVEARKSYQSDPSREVNRTIAAISRAERAGDWNLLYDLMIPDARMLVPRVAFGNWYPTVTPPPPGNAVRIDSLQFQDFIYPLLNKNYTNVATVEYSYPIVSGETVNRTANLVQIGSNWRWLPDWTDDTVQTIRQEMVYTVDVPIDPALDGWDDLNRYWSQIFADWGKEYIPPIEVINVKQPTPSQCGDLEGLNNEFIAQYCPPDHMVYYNDFTRNYFTRLYGDASWHMVIAHEWGHHIEQISGLFVFKSPEIFGGSYSIEHELLADCLSATYMQDLVARDVFSDADLAKFNDMMMGLGDAAGTPWDQEGAHGTGDQRRQSFWTGWDDGLWGCNIDASTGT